MSSNAYCSEAEYEPFNAARTPVADNTFELAMADTQFLTSSQVAGLDDPAVLNLCQVGPQGADGRIPVGLGLSGLYCASCALTIESALARLPGVSDVQVQGTTQRARLVLDPAKVRMSDLVAAVMQAGYRAWPDGAADAATARQGVQRQLLWRLVVAAFCMMQVMMVTTSQYVASPGDIPADLWQLLNWTAWVISLPVMVFSCGPFFQGAWLALRQGRIAMDTPVAIGIAAMFVVSTGVMLGYTDLFGHDLYFDSLTMFVAFLLFGRWLESRAREKVTQSLESLCAKLPEAVERSAHQNWLMDETEQVPVSALRVGDHVRVPVGQAFPADGVVLAGQTEVDESLLTGESRAVVKGLGHQVISGSMNLGGAVWFRVDKLGHDTRYQQVVNLVQQALTDKPGWLRFADRFAGPFLWAVLALALLGALAWQWIDPDKSIWVAVSVLVVTCPCALSLAAPSALLAASGALAKQGILVKHLDALEALANVGAMLFDKTGTLTTATPQVVDVWMAEGTWPVAKAPVTHERLLVNAAALAAHSSHPVAQGLAAWRAANATEKGARWQQVTESIGYGLQAQDDSGRVWRLGSAEWVFGAAAGPDFQSRWPMGRIWFAPANNGVLQSSHEVLGVSLDENTREGAKTALEDLRHRGVDVALLSGDHPDRVNQFADALALQPALPVAAAGATPEGKLQALIRVRKTLEGSRRVLAVVGDGVNDAPVLAGAQVSFALDHGAALAQSQADFIVLGGRLSGICQAVDTSRKAIRVVRQNLIWAAAYNFVCIPLALWGYFPPWLAGLGMALSSLAVLVNALRVSRG